MRCVAQFVLVLATGGVDGVAELLGDVTLAGTLFSLVCVVLLLAFLLLFLLPI